MASMQSLSVFVTERLTLAAQEIFKAVEVTVSEYHQEISRSRQENELLKRRLLEAGIDLYTELQPNMPSMPIMHDGDGDAGQGPPACGEQWGQTSEEIQVKLELSATQERLQDAPSQIAVANEPVSPKPCLQSEQKMEDMFQSQTAETSMDNLLLAGPYIQVKQEPNELVSNLGPQTLCDVQSCIPSYPNNAAAASGHTSGLGGEMDSQRMSSLHKPGRSKMLRRNRRRVEPSMDGISTEKSFMVESLLKSCNFRQKLREFLAQTKKALIPFMSWYDTVTHGLGPKAFGITVQIMDTYLNQVIQQLSEDLGS